MSVIVPTRDEADNVQPLLTGLEEALAGIDAEVLIVDDSDDATPEIARQAAVLSAMRVQIHARPPGQRPGGLGGAVLVGLSKAAGPVCVVMDADLQHPPELLKTLLHASGSGAGFVVASRYLDGGTAEGLSGRYRRAVSTLTTSIAKWALRPELGGISDPLSGFFLVRRSCLDLASLHPQGFKLLLELLVHSPQASVTEVPYTFGARHSGASKASIREGLTYLKRLIELRAQARRAPRRSRAQAQRAVRPRLMVRFAAFCRGFSDNALDRIFDRLLGVSTGGIVITEGSIYRAGGDNVGYEGSHWLPVRRALKGLAPGPSDVLIDLGSGKGKVLLVAGRLPYRRVVGVEIDAELSRCSRRNIEQARTRLRAQEVDSVTASALEWPIPDEASVIFMYNPFIGQTFHATVGKIFESYDRRPRSLHIVYDYPWEHDWLLSTGRVVVDSVRSSRWLARPRWWQTGYVIVSYRVVGATQQSQSSSSPRRLIGSHRAIQRWSRSNGHLFTLSAPGQKTPYAPVPEVPISADERLR